MNGGSAVGAAAVVVIRGMSRRWRRQDDGDDDVSVPYGPEAPLEAAVPEIAPSP